MEPDHLMTPSEVSVALGRSLNTLRNWRAQRKRLRFVKAGQRVYYRAADVAAFQQRDLQLVEVEVDDA